MDTEYQEKIIGSLHSESTDQMRMSSVYLLACLLGADGGGARGLWVVCLERNESIMGMYLRHTRVVAVMVCCSSKSLYAGPASAVRCGTMCDEGEAIRKSCGFVSVCSRRSTSSSFSSWNGKRVICTILYLNTQCRGRSWLCPLADRVSRPVVDRVESLLRRVQGGGAGRSGEREGVRSRRRRA